MVTISNNQWFPIFGFVNINGSIEKADTLKNQQKTKMQDYIVTISDHSKQTVTSIDSILNDDSIVKTRKSSFNMEFTQWKSRFR